MSVTFLLFPMFHTLFYTKLSAYALKCIKYLLIMLATLLESYTFTYIRLLGR